MFGTIRKHQTWLWAVIITLTIISFVIFFSPYSKLNNERRGPANYGSINGEPITDQDFADAWRELDLQYFFRSGGNSWPNDEAKRMGFDQEREAYQWLLLVQKQKQLGIHISSEMAAQTALGMLSQLQQKEQQQITPDIFLKGILRPHGLSNADFDRFVRHYLGIQELIATVGLPGKLVTPQEAQAVYVRQHEELVTEAVFFAATNYMAEIKVTPEAVAQFYAGDTNKYLISDRVQVTYLKFGVSNYLAEAESDLKTNLTEMVEGNMKRMGTNYLRFGKTPEEAKVKVREELLRSQALSHAHRRAAEFAQVLFEMTNGISSLESLALSNKMTVQVSAPFERDDGPKDLEVGEDFAKAAFSLSPTEPFASPVVGKDGVYVFALKNQIPASIPPLEQIRDQVTADYKHSQALMRARQEGTALSQKVTLGMAQGKTFDAICAEAKAKPVVLPPFSLSTRQIAEVQEHLTPDQLRNLAFSTAPGKVSNFQATGEGGVILYVKSKLPLNVAKMNTDLPSFAQNLRLTRQQEAFNVWFSREAEKALRDAPPFRKQAPPNVSKSRKS